MKMRSPSSDRRGAVLLVVLIVIVLLTLAAYKFNELMLAEARASDSSIRAGQARAFALSGVHYTAAQLAGGYSPLNAGSSSSFQNVAVNTTGPANRAGRFSIYSLNAGDLGSGLPASPGVTCEAGKINVNALLAYDKGKGDAGLKMLMALPGMTQEAAAAILDWVDPDDTPRQSGAENETYSSFDPPYRCKNGPLDSLEELLLVQGVTPEMVFGNDKNRNGVIDPGEDDGSGSANLGLQAFLTVHSRELNYDQENQVRTNVNAQDLVATVSALNSTVGEDLSLYIAAARLYGTTSSSSSSGTSGSTSSGGSTSGTGSTSGGGSTSGASGGASTSGDTTEAKTKIQEDLAASASKKLKNIASLWDLVNSSVTVTVGTGRTQKKITYPSPLKDQTQQRDLLPKLLNYCTTNNKLELTPRININTAPEAVVTSLKDVASLTDEVIQNILTKRPTLGSSSAAEEIYRTPAWLLTEAGLSISACKKMETFATTQSMVYRFQSMGSFEQGGPTARFEAVVDTNLGRPRIVFLRDISELGPGFAGNP